MSKRDELRVFMVKSGYMEQSRAMFDMAIDAAREEALAEVRAERGSVIKDAAREAFALVVAWLPPAGVASGTPAPEPAPVPCPPPFAWCKQCGCPAPIHLYCRECEHLGTRTPATPFDEGSSPAPAVEPHPPRSPFRLCVKCGLPADPATRCSDPFDETHIPNLDDWRPTSPAEEYREEVKKLRDALREILDTAIKVAGSDSMVLRQIQAMAVHALNEWD